MPYQRTQRTAFTLVELLAVMVVLGILAGMVTAALSSVKETARAAKTRAIITSIDEVLQAKWEEYRVRPFSVELVSDPFAPSSTYTMQPTEAARVRLLMVRDLMRMELPDRQTDITTPPMDLRTIVSSRETGTLAPALVSWWRGPGGTVSTAIGPALYLSYGDRVSGGSWTAEHQGAECLYLILSTTFQNGISGLEMIPPGNIGDVDEDGVPEILDGWGQPLGFLRWPVGAATADDLALGADEFDPFRADFGYYDASVMDAFSLRPLVVSAGPDGVFDIRFTKSSGPYTYRDKTWPGTGRPDPYYFIDPYQRHDADGELFGAPVDTNSDGTISSDNISNYNVETSS